MYVTSKHWLVWFSSVLTVLMLTGCQSFDPFSEARIELEQQRQEVALLKQQLNLREGDLNLARQRLAEEQQRLHKQQIGLQQKKRALKRSERKLEDQRLQLAATLRTLPAEPLVIMGEAEQAYLPEYKLFLNARIDTGAKTSSVNAQDIVYFERDGKRHVRFNMIDPANGRLVELELPVVRRVRIKDQDGQSERRPVIKMRVVIGSIEQKIQLTLANREDYEYPLLIGRNMLKDYAVVDVSRKYVLSNMYADDESLRDSQQ